MYQYFLRIGNQQSLALHRAAACAGTTKSELCKLLNSFFSQLALHFQAQKYNFFKNDNNYYSITDTMYQILSIKNNHFYFYR